MKVIRLNDVLYGFTVKLYAKGSAFYISSHGTDPEESIAIGSNDLYQDTGFRLMLKLQA